MTEIPDPASMLDLVKAIARGPLAIGVLVLARVAPIALVSPVFGGAAAPKRFRAAMALGLAVTLTPTLLPAMSPIIDPVRLSGLLLKELTIGFAISFAATFVFDMLQAVGAICDVSRAGNLADLFDPLTASDQTMLQVFLRRLLVVLFFSLDGHVPLIEGLAASFRAAPVGEAMPAWLAGRAIGGQALALLADMTVVAIRLSAPVIVLTLAAELSVGMLGRVHSSIDTDVPARSVKLLLGLLAFALTLGYGLGEALGDGVRRIVHIATGT